MSEKNYLKLSEVLKTVSATVNDLFPLPQWVEAEIVSININKFSGHCYLEIMETDSNGNEVCKTKVSIWKSNVNKIFEKFKNSTNSDLRAGVKVLFKCKISFHMQYQLSMSIDDINPEYTLGGMELKIKEIVERLEKEGIVNKNKLLKSPFDFHNVAVISPPDAAGLGDFKKDADILDKYNICKFDYYGATFQGKDTCSSIVYAINEVFKKYERYDALIIIRGGGAKTDLHFLNEYEIAKTITNSKIPVFVGVGHERDKGILDLVAHSSFDTPSKVIGHIFSIINENSNIIKNNFNYIVETSKNNILKNKLLIKEDFNSIHKLTTKFINIYKSEIDIVNSSLLNLSKNIVMSNKLKINNDFENTCQNAKTKIESVKLDINNFINSIHTDGKRTIDLNKKDISLLIQQIKTFSPDELLNFGFAIVRKNKNLVTSTKDLIKDEELEIFFKNGSVKVKIIGD